MDGKKLHRMSGQKKTTWDLSQKKRGLYSGKKLYWISGKLGQDDPACRSRLPLHGNEGQVLFSFCISSKLHNFSSKVGEGGRGGQGMDKETGRTLWDVVQADRFVYGL